MTLNKFEWRTPQEDEPPKAERLLYVVDGRVYVGEIYDLGLTDGVFDCDPKTEDCKRVTHWMPFPAPPLQSTMIQK